MMLLIIVADFDIGSQLDDAAVHRKEFVNDF